MCSPGSSLNVLNENITIHVQTSLAFCLVEEKFHSWPTRAAARRLKHLRLNWNCQSWECFGNKFSEVNTMMCCLLKHERVSASSLLKDGGLNSKSSIFEKNLRSTVHAIHYYDVTPTPLLSCICGTVSEFVQSDFYFPVLSHFFFFFTS